MINQQIVKHECMLSSCSGWSIAKEKKSLHISRLLLKIKIHPLYTTSNYYTYIVFFVFDQYIVRLTNEIDRGRKYTLSY